MRIPTGLEVCYKCGGDGGCLGSDFGDYGVHPCFRCATTGYLPEGTVEREQEQFEYYPDPIPNRDYWEGGYYDDCPPEYDGADQVL